MTGAVPLISASIVTATSIGKQSFGCRQTITPAITHNATTAAASTTVTYAATKAYDRPKGSVRAPRRRPASARSGAPDALRCGR